MSKKPPNGTRNEYLEVKILERRCYVSRDDFRILHGLAGNTTAASPKQWSEIDEDSFIVKILCYRKWQKGGGRPKVSPAHAGEKGAGRTLGPGAGTVRP